MNISSISLLLLTMAGVLVGNATSDDAVDKVDNVCAPPFLPDGYQGRYV